MLDISYIFIWPFFFGVTSYISIYIYICPISPARKTPFILGAREVHSDGRDQLPLRAQTFALQALGAGAHQGRMDEGWDGVDFRLTWSVPCIYIDR